MTKILPGIRTVSNGTTDIVAIDESFELDAGEALTGTPTVTEVDTSDLTISQKTINSTELNINGNTVAANSAVLFKISGQKAGTLYHIKYVVSTTNVSGRSLSWIVRLQCR